MLKNSTQLQRGFFGQTGVLEHREVQIPPGGPEEGIAAAVAGGAGSGRNGPV
jgi:hypothetical protein